MARHPGRRDQRTQAAKAHAVIRGVEDQRGAKLSGAQKRAIIQAAGAAPYPPRQGVPRKWARRAAAERHRLNTG